MAYALSNSTSALNIMGKLHDFAAQWQTARDQRAIYNRTYNRTYNELNRLEDRDLADIGIARAAIAEIARDAAEKAV
jgi:uncharacterized protein YjiS (DUF1127 family)